MRLTSSIIKFSVDSINMIEKPGYMEWWVVLVT